MAIRISPLKAKQSSPKQRRDRCAFVTPAISLGREAVVAHQARADGFVRRALWNSGIIGIIVSDFDGAVVNANQAFLKMTGTNRRDLKNGKLRWSDMTPTAYLALDERGKRDMLRHRACIPFEKEYVRQDGTRIPVLIGAALLQPSRRHCVAFIVDLTERKQSQEALRQAEEQRQREAVLRERNRLAREIHDTLAQALAGIVIQLEVAEQAVGSSTRAAKAHLTAAKNLARASLAEARRSVGALRTNVRQAGQLRYALGHLLANMNTNPPGRLRYCAPASLRIPFEAEIEIVRIVQEAVTNAVKHARATAIDVSVDATGSGLAVKVEDNGCGFDPRLPREGCFGLIGLHERAERLGAELTVTTALGSGTSVMLRVATDRITATGDESAAH
jgi:PAS domain S-box-containing protein